MAVKRPENSHLFPYYERMKRSYMKNRKSRAKARKPDGNAAAQEGKGSPRTRRSRPASEDEPLPFAHSNSRVWSFILGKDKKHHAEGP